MGRTTCHFDLIVCAEDSAIVTAARDLEALGASAEAVQADLGRPEGVERLRRPGARSPPSR